MRDQSRAVISEKVTAALRLVQLEQLGDRLPKQLSGGQQQRVALARALVFDPDLLLMDEPLGALDRNLREQMQFELRRLHGELGITVVFVTHDQEEALTLSDRVALMNHGAIVQIGSAEDLYERPASRFVAEFIGESNVLPGRIDGAWFTVEGGARLPCPDDAPRDATLMVVRPEKLALTSSGCPYNRRDSRRTCLCRRLHPLPRGDRRRPPHHREGAEPARMGSRAGRPAGWPAPRSRRRKPADIMTTTTGRSDHAS